MESVGGSRQARQSLEASLLSIAEPLLVELIDMARIQRWPSC